MPTMRFIALLIIVSLLGGCGLLRGNRGSAGGTSGTVSAAEGSGNSGSQGGESAAGAGARSNSVSIHSGDTITTITSAGTITTTSKGAPGDLSGIETGAGSSSGGRGLLFWFYLFLGVAILAWLLWSIWHRTRMHRVERHYYRPDEPVR